MSAWIGQCADRPRPFVYADSQHCCHLLSPMLIITNLMLAHLVPTIAMAVTGVAAVATTRFLCLSFTCRHISLFAFLAASEFQSKNSHTSCILLYTNEAESRITHATHTYLAQRRAVRRSSSPAPTSRPRTPQLCRCRLPSPLTAVLDWLLCVYIYIYVHVCMYIYIYI